VIYFDVSNVAAAIIKARGLSSAAAPQAAVNTVYKLSIRAAGDGSAWACIPTALRHRKGLIFSYPIRSNGKDFEIVQACAQRFSKAKSPRRSELKEEVARHRFAAEIILSIERRVTRASLLKMRMPIPTGKHAWNLLASIPPLLG